MSAPTGPEIYYRGVVNGAGRVLAFYARGFRFGASPMNSIRLMVEGLDARDRKTEKSVNGSRDIHGTACLWSY